MNTIKVAFLDELKRRFGVSRKLENSSSIYEIADGKTCLYIRYSKKHPRNRTFFGLRKIDLQAIEAHAGIICFLWSGQDEPLFVPLAEFADTFAMINPARDGQYKVQIYEGPGGTELYIANAGRFNVESYRGWEVLKNQIGTINITIPELTHIQVQTLLAGIGVTKGFDVWIPMNDRLSLDWSLTPAFQFPVGLPPALTPIRDIAEAIDVMWLERGAGHPTAFFEVEHSTPIYSGLLRFNDVHLTLPHINMRFGIVSNDERRSVYVRQLRRPTFKVSGLSELCMFLEDRDVFGWYRNLKRGDGIHGKAR
jgi:hypothetical protein